MLGWRQDRRRWVLKASAWTALVVALVIPVVVLLLRGLSDAASVAQLVSLPLATVSLILALPIWSRRTGLQTDNQITTTTAEADDGEKAKVFGKKPWLVILMVLALLVGGAGIGTFALYTAGAFSTEILAEPVQVPGENPFTPPVGSDQPNVEPPRNVGRTFPGSTSGLYGGTLNNSSCDPQAMVAFLQANPQKAAAWAGVLGITPDDISGYVAGLTPLILRSDAAVTNHGFRDGMATNVHSGSHTLTRNGTTWRASGLDEGAVFCRPSDQSPPAPVPGTSITFKLTVNSAAAINGIWRAQNLRATYSTTAPGVAGTDCSASKSAYELSN